MARGIVYLIGAGPGDPELITVKALRALRRCDVVLVDDLVNRELLRQARRGARVIDVGKRGRDAAAVQERIAALMIRFARPGHRVARLKGGDPFVFGRGAEEVAVVRAAGIRVEVIPGVTAGLAVPAAAGIAVTERLVSRGVALVTARTADGTDVDWAALARSGLTIVVYMGVGRVAAITRALLAAGLAPSTPAAAIENGTLPTQRTIRTTLADLAAAMAARGIRSPAVLVIGDVAAAAGVPELSALERRVS